MSALAQRSPKERMWIVGGAIGALLLVLVGWFLVISPQRSDTDERQAQIDTVRTENISLRSRITSLAAESKDMTNIKTALASAQQALPGTTGETDFLRSLQTLGTRTGTSVVNVTVTAPAPVAPATSGSAPAPATSAAKPAASSVYVMTISAQVNGSTDALNRFLDQLQRVQPRAVLITQLTEGSTADASGSGTSLQLGMQAFVAP